MSLCQCSHDHYFGHAHFKLLIRGVDDSGVWSAGTDETDPLRTER